MYVHGFMAFTRLFRNGNSLAARIPAELAYGRSKLEQELEQEMEQYQELELAIKRVGVALRRVAEV